MNNFPSMMLDQGIGLQKGEKTQVFKENEFLTLSLRIIINNHSSNSHLSPTILHMLYFLPN
jgi:hypothetical protein